MLSDGENFTRKEYSSPFQLDPFCCRCPLVLENLSPAGRVESDPNLLITMDPSVGGSFENLHDSPSPFQGLRFFSGSRRQGSFINGMFYGNAGFDGRSSRSDSGYEYSSDDDDESRGRTRQPLNATFPRPRDPSWRSKQMFRHSTLPGFCRDDDKVSDLENGTPKGYPGVTVVQKNVRQEESGDEAATVSFEQRVPNVTQGASLPGNGLQEVHPTAKNDCLENSFLGGEVMSGAGEDNVSVEDNVISELQVACSDQEGTCLAPESGTGNMTAVSQHCSSSEESAPYQSATSRPCTPDPFPSDLTDGHCIPSSVDPAEDPEKRTSLESPGAKGPNQSQHLSTETETEETHSFGSCEKLLTGRTPDSSRSNSISSDKELSGEGFHTSESRRSSVEETESATTEVETPHSEKEEIAGKNEGICNSIQPKGEKKFFFCVQNISSFYLNGNTLGFYTQTQKLESPCFFFNIINSTTRKYRLTANVRATL